MKRFTEKAMSEIADIRESIELQAERLTQMMGDCTEGADTYCILAAASVSLGHAADQLTEAE